MKFISLTLLLLTVIGAVGCSSKLQSACDNYSEAVILLDYNGFWANNYSVEEIIQIKSEMSDLIFDLVDNSNKLTKTEFENIFIGSEISSILIDAKVANQDDNVLELRKIGVILEKINQQNLALNQFFDDKGEYISWIILRVISRANHRNFELKYGKKSLSEAEQLYRNFILGERLGSGMTLSSAKLESEEMTLTIPKDPDIRNEWIRIRFIAQRDFLAREYINFLKSNKSKEAQEALIKLKEFDTKEAPMLEKYQLIRKKKFQRQILNR